MIANSSTSNGDHEYKSYSYRWVILTIFCLLDLCNAILFVTFAPISNISQNYFGGGDYGTSSAVNMLATMFLILYPVGTVIGIVFMKYYRLRNTLIFAGAINAFGALLRLLAAVYREELGDGGCYCLMLLGQSIAALAYPMYVNLPAAIASTWFPVNERDMSTTIGALFNPIGNAAGQVIPAFIVYQKSQSPSAYHLSSLLQVTYSRLFAHFYSGGDDDGAKVYGMVTLMAVELVICAVPLALAVLFFRDAPPTPPSHSTNLKLEVRICVVNAI
jgi:MFS family permease